MPLAKQFGATSMALADVDGDGDLDLYVTNYRTDTFQDSPAGLKIETRRQADGSMALEPRDRFVSIRDPRGALQVLERGEKDILYINRGGGRFSPVPWDVGTFVDEDEKPLSGTPTDWGLSVLFRDFNNDGFPDLYVCNDFVYWPDRLWLNQEGKRFRAAPRLSLRNVSLSSMAVDVADVNRDGYDDIFVAEMLSPRRESRAWQRPDTLSGTVVWPVSDPNFRPEVTRNTLHQGRGDGSFSEIAQLAGVAATDWTWGVLFLDVDLDGWEDLLVATGSFHDVQDADFMGRALRSDSWRTYETRLKTLETLPHRETPSVAFRNRRDLTFEDASAAWGFNAVGVAHGMAVADLDNDGDMDVAINCLNAPARLLRNETSAPRVAVRLQGAGTNTHGIGGRIKVTGGPVRQSQEIIAGGRYCSSDDAMRVFAAGTAKELEIEVTWRGGKRTIVKGVLPDHVYEISEKASAAAAEIPNPPSPLFEDVSALLNHLHVNVPFDDFARQPLLTRKLSTLGPGVTWADVNGDGHEDLVIAGGRGDRAVVFMGDGKGGFVPWTDTTFPKTNEREQTTILVSSATGGVGMFLTGESTWETGSTNAPPFSMTPIVKTTEPSKSMATPAGGRSSTGPMALADINGDGELDLFVGGRAVAGRYPEPASSKFFRWTGSGCEISQQFDNLGLVSGAVFTDFDGDGDPDLVLACEWDSIRLFRNDKGVLVEVTKQMGMESFGGLWNGVAAADIDGDGRMDLVASNWGRNWRTDLAGGEDVPVRLYYGDFADDGIVQTLVASLDPALGKITAWREKKVVALAIPSVGQRFQDFRAYGRAGILELLGAKASGARELVAWTTDSMVFLNKGDHFEGRALPVEAQFAPAFGVSAADFDGDGREDVFLAQNFFGVDAETSRQDSGVGLVLLGDGRGGFRALGPLESGVACYGEQRGSAAADFDGDGRVDLAVGQQGGFTKLFRNKGAPQGVRVVLRGPKRNPAAVGATVRLKFSDGSSPAREIHAGSGYLSQDSATQTFGTPKPAQAALVRWPGGQEQEFPWPSGAKAVEVSPDGIRAQPSAP